MLACMRDDTNDLASHEQQAPIISLVDSRSFCPSEMQDVKLLRLSLYTPHVELSPL
jgi:hypothetical protein